MKQGKLTSQDEAFAAALQHIAKSFNYDTKKIAELAEKKVRTINYVYSLQRGMGKKTAFQLAEKLDTSYSSMLSLGEWILDEKDPSKWMANDTANVSKSPSDPLLVKIEKWLTEREQIDQKFRKSFEEDFNNKFPDFLKWHQEIESHKRLSEKLTSTLISSSYFFNSSIHPKSM